jgi:L-cystine transport system permease protein
MSDHTDRIIHILLESFLPLLKAGVAFTIPLTLISFALGLSLALFSALVQIQWEAAYSIGMTKSQALRRIILPQAARVSVPPLSNSFISLVKDTSLASVVTVTEMFAKAQEITAVYYEPMVLYCEVAVIYLLFSSVLSNLQRRLEKRFDRYTAR